MKIHFDGFEYTFYVNFKIEIRPKRSSSCVRSLMLRTLEVVFLAERLDFKLFWESMLPDPPWRRGPSPLFHTVPYSNLTAAYFTFYCQKTLPM